MREEKSTWGGEGRERGLLVYDILRSTSALTHCRCIGDASLAPVSSLQSPSARFVCSLFGPVGLRQEHPTVTAG